MARAALHRAKLAEHHALHVHHFPNAPLGQAYDQTTYTVGLAPLPRHVFRACSA